MLLGKKTRSQICCVFPKGGGSMIGFGDKKNHNRLSIGLFIIGARAMNPS
jgi:hypothetical protein